jgi:DNA-binding CsgD family transcriptional regulator
MISNSESKVIAYLQQGLSNRDIADSLNVSEKTIKFHLTNIYKKHEVRSRSELISKLVGWSTPEVSMKELSTEVTENKQPTSQMQKIEFINDKFKVGDSINQLHSMMKGVTKDGINPATVNAACNCVARLNETINTAIQAAKFLNER